MTARAFTTAFDSAIQAATLRPVLFYEGEFASSSFLRLWSGFGDISWNGYTWTGGGNLLGISPLEERGDVKAQGFTVTLSGMPSSIVSLALASLRQGKPGKLWLGLIENPPHFAFPGTVNNELNTVDAPANRITGDIALVTRVRAQTPASQAWLVGKSRPSLARAYEFYFTSARKLRGVFSNGPNIDSTVALPIADWQYVYVAISRVSATGTVKFHYSVDGVAWTQLGADVAGAAGAITNVNQRVSVGETADNNQNLFANVYSAQIYDGIPPMLGGSGSATPAVNMNPADYVSGTKFTSSTSGETWTISGSGVTFGYGPEGNLIADPYQLRNGKLDISVIDDDGETATIAMQYEDRLIDLDRARERRYTSEDQAIDYPTDLGFEFVPSLQDAQIIWGGPGAAASPVTNATTGGGGGEVSPGDAGYGSRIISLPEGGYAIENNEGERSRVRNVGTEAEPEWERYGPRGWNGSNNDG